MRKLVLAISILFTTNFAFAQTEVARFSSGSFNILLSSAQKNIAADSIKSALGLDPRCTLDSVVVNDPAPNLLDSSAYISFYFDCGGVSYTLGFYITKTSNHGDIVYFIDDDNASVEKAWKCSQGPICKQCPPKRNWFAGPVKGCDCEPDNDCVFETSGGGQFPWAAVVGLVGVLITLLAN